MNANQKRANAFKQAVLVYCKHKGIDLDEEGLYTVVTDLLTDALHFANVHDQESLDLAAQSEVAEMHFAEETQEDGE